MCWKTSLGDALWGTLKHLLKAIDRDVSPARALATAASLKSADIILPKADGREILLRRGNSPIAGRRTFFERLGMPNPERLSFDQECSTDFAAV